jgi:HD-GYP domain-containing protein (c-di-GMP phosphodiesterase class II)
MTSAMPDRSRWTIPALLGALAAAPAILVAALGGRMVMPSPYVHFGVVAAAAAVAAGAAVALTVAGARAHDGRTVLMGMAFSTMTALFGVHGLTTPGVLVGPNGVIALAGGLSIPVGGGLLALTALPALRRTRRIRPLLVLQGVLAAAVVALGVVGMTIPSSVPTVPRAGSDEALVLLAIGLFFCAVLTDRAVRTHGLTRRPADLLVAVGCAWLGVALVAQLVIGSMTLGYYVGHVLELAAVALIAVPAARDIVRSGASRPLVGDLSATDLVASEEAYLGPRVRALMVRLAERDGSTEEHTRRVAILAAQVGEELRLPAGTRRHLAVGGLLHDIGKLSVPLHILRKPAGLTDAEYAQVKRHPEAGRRLLEELGGFSPTVRDLVSDHHERLDGAGYPRGLTEDELPLHTRILTVCDVYDALVSDRVYRSAWTPERAFELLREDAGRAFDARCVEALAKVVGRDDGRPGWVAALALPGGGADERGAGPERTAATATGLRGQSARAGQ